MLNEKSKYQEADNVRCRLNEVQTQGGKINLWCISHYDGSSVIGNGCEKLSGADYYIWKCIYLFFFFSSCAEWLAGSLFPNQGTEPRPWQ